MIHRNTQWKKKKTKIETETYTTLTVIPGIDMLLQTFHAQKDA